MPDAEESEEYEDPPGAEGPPADEEGPDAAGSPGDGQGPEAEGSPAAGNASGESVRKRVEKRHDFDDFGPEDMAEMTADEWEAAFDPESWTTGTELLDRVEADLKDRVASRDVFARVERIPDPDRVVAYSDEGYAVAFEDGSVEGHGTVLRDLKPTVALCSMPGYEVPPAPDGDVLPKPMEVPEESGELGNLMVQLIAAAQVLAGVGLLGATPVVDGGLITVVAGLGFLVFGLFLFLVVANARLSDRFRAEEYRNRLRAVGIDAGDPPETLPPDLRESLIAATRDDETDGSG